MVLGEHQLISAALPLIRQTRAEQRLPDIPIVILSATTDTPKDERDEWTRFHADLASSVPNGEHIILADTSHAINQERPAEIAAAINRVLDRHVV
jgi:pimeloyl-ACP methyl ester carboxylesterase